LKYFLLTLKTQVLYFNHISNKQKMRILKNEAIELVESDAPLTELQLSYVRLVAEGLELTDIMATLGLGQNEIGRLDRSIQKEFDIMF